MKNIITIFLSDCRRVGRNVVAIVVIMGLTILPSLYGWFNILSNWDPYGAEALKTNDTIGWVFADSSKQAIDGVYAGDYYAALIVTEDFTKDMISFMTDSVTNPEIVYYTNQKKNAIAPKITDKAKTAVRQQVNSTFVSKLTETLLKAAGTVGSFNNNNNLASSENNSGSMLDFVVGRLEAVNIHLESYDTIIGALLGIIDTTQTTSGMVENMSPDITDMFQKESDMLSHLQTMLDNKVMTDNNLFGQMSLEISRLQSAMHSVSNLYEQVGGNLTAFNSAIGQMGDNLSETKTIITDLRESLSKTVQELNAVKDSGEYHLLSSVLTLNAQDLGAFVAAPVTMDSVELYPIDNYGSAMSAFYTVLALWVGALILVAIIHVKVQSIEP